MSETGKGSETPMDMNDELNKLHQQLAKKPRGRRGMAWVQIPRSGFEELHERIRMLNDIALSAIALKIRIEHGFPPTLDALNRDLDAYQRWFGGPLK
jgi:hypothetical protein